MSVGMAEESISAAAPPSTPVARGDGSEYVFPSTPFDLAGAKPFRRLFPRTPVPRAADPRRRDHAMARPASPAMEYNYDDEPDNGRYVEHPVTPPPRAGVAEALERMLGEEAVEERRRSVLLRREEREWSEAAAARARDGHGRVRHPTPLRHLMDPRLSPGPPPVLRPCSARDDAEPPAPFTLPELDEAALAAHGSAFAMSRGPAPAHPEPRAAHRSAVLQMAGAVTPPRGSAAKRDRGGTLVAARPLVLPGQTVHLPSAAPPFPADAPPRKRHCGASAWLF